jgi:hypothetical protein
VTTDEIKKSRIEIEGRLREHDANRKTIEADLLRIQHICLHPNATSYNDGGSYGGPSFASTYWNCPDCGLKKTT